MKQIWIPKNGAPDVLEVREAADPSPAAGEVLIETAAAGINFADIMARMGLYPDAPPLPCVVGYEVAGTVTAIGSGVTEFAVGQRVAAATRFGGYASHVAVPAVQVAAIADHVSFEAAATVPVNYLTAWLMLVRLGNVRAGDRVLVHAVAGGVGQAALQICLWRGATVFGTASGSKHERLRELGVAHCIDYRTQDFESEIKRLTDGRGVDIALDAVGGKSFTKSYRSLAKLGRLYVFGASSAVSGHRRNLITAAKTMLQMRRYGPMDLMNKNRGVQGVNLGDLWDRMDVLGADLREIIGLVEDGTFEPRVDKTFPFAEAAAAHAWIQDRKNFGKVLLTP